MAANSLFVGLITYTAAIVYNLLARKSLETVFYLGLRFMLYTTLMVLFLQLSFHLVINFNSQGDSEADNTDTENSDAAAETEENNERSEFENQEFEESAVENEFDNEEFSALNQEEFDYQQNNNQ